MITYEFANKTQLEIIAGLLKQSDLPSSDIEESQVDFIVAWDDSKIFGCIGLEKFGTEGLLRSFAVDNTYRKRGYGKELYNRLLAFAVQNEITTLHLLTDTAKEYFMKAGFSARNRSNAPEILQGTKEFASLCPSSSLYMVLENLSEHVLYIDQKLFKTRMDDSAF